MSLLKMPNEISKEFYLKALVYGQPGIGKSTVASSMPDSVLIDCDNGVHRISPEHRIPFLPVKSYDEVLELLASPEIQPFKTIIFDTAGKLLDFIAQYIIKREPKMGRKDGALTLQGYGVRKYEFINLLKRITIMQKHVIFVAHEIEERDSDSRYIRPEIGGSSGADLIKELDIVGYMEAIGRKRTISFSPSDKYYAKNAAHLDDVIEVPELARGQANTFLLVIVEKVKAAMEEETEQYKQYAELVATHIKAIEAIKDVKTANETLKQLAAVQHIWDSKVKIWNALQAKTSSLGLTLNSKEKKYEKAEKAAA